MVRVLIIDSMEEPDETTEMLMEESGKNLEIDRFPIKEIKLSAGSNLNIQFNGNNIEDYDYVIPRIEAYHSLLAYNILRIVDDLGIPMSCNPDTVIIGHDKFSTLESLQSEGVEIPKTNLVNSAKVAKEVIDEMDFPLMIKIPNGTEGKGVIFVESRESANSVVDAIEGFGRNILVEEFIENPREDIRVFVIDGEVVGSMKRIARKDDVRSNLSLGGSAEKYESTEEENKVSIKSAEAIGAKIAGVDIIQSKDSPVVTEVNVNPAGFEDIRDLYDKNIASNVIDLIKREIEK